MLIKRSKVVTNFVLPVIINMNYKTNFYYDTENTLFKAYRQLKAINSKIVPLHPVIYGNAIKEYENGVYLC